MCFGVVFEAGFTPTRWMMKEWVDIEVRSLRSRVDPLGQHFACSLKSGLKLRFWTERAVSPSVANNPHSFCMHNGFTETYIQTSVTSLQQTTSRNIAETDGISAETSEKARSHQNYVFCCCHMQKQPTPMHFKMVKQPQPGEPCAKGCQVVRAKALRYVRVREVTRAQVVAGATYRSQKQQISVFWATHPRTTENRRCMYQKFLSLRHHALSFCRGT